ncbi:pyridoxamine 5'-phosphate oxidase family protein [Bacteroides caecigallinarum]|uniref:pyridoxamine 5'-phosphate oxidase family protein n=1 Tax=Bacteroides caecigallinarum TaxID=1411144 RepID=UPI001F398851|nr:pyridoxamine 5'-phosphate oxidase family protein [Bacteroides caecigallinarum]MCF2551060.1 pyridoxamine 5'-phosphate oxidase family protein [Bacteroides caecigallinarum]
MEISNKIEGCGNISNDNKRIYEILKEGEYGILSMVADNGDNAYGVPLNYVWDRGNSIYIQCSPVGKKLRCIDANHNVSFCVVGKTKMNPENFTTGYESVIMKCTAHHSLHEAERMSALSLLISKYCKDNGIAGMEYANRNFHRIEIIRLDIESMSAKCKATF